MIVPQESEGVVPDEHRNDEHRNDDESNPFSEFQVFDDDFDEPELIYEPDTSSSSDLKQKLNDRLSIPRRMVYIQGVLLGIVAVLFFLLGLMVGSKADSAKGSQANNRSLVKGRVFVGNEIADEGAVVFLFPSKLRPAGRFETEELVPGRSFTSGNPEVRLIRNFGGNVSTVNQAGQFEMLVQSNREYVLFVVSANSKRTRDLDSDYHSNVGHYFTSLDHLAADRVCYYRKVMPIGSRENLGQILMKSSG
ncbi:MAG: hypothetical protein VX438_07660 [Planctomycetota bacterium]|nr:hypothetical protein [Planctomycetota bacterium]